MGYKKEMTHEEHTILGTALSQAKGILQNAHIAVANNMDTANDTKKYLMSARNTLDMACAELDILYHSVTTDEQFEKHGHVYYGGKPQ